MEASVTGPVFPHSIVLMIKEEGFFKQILVCNLLFSSREEIAN